MLMSDQELSLKVKQESLLEIIRTQTEIAKLGIDLGSVMTCVAERAQQLTRASGAVVELAEGSEMVYRAACGTAETQLGLRLAREGSLSGLCVESGQILRCDDSHNDARVNRAACEKVGLRSMIVVPLRHLDSTIGVLKVMSSTVCAFDEEDSYLLGLISELIAAAMFHATRFEAKDLLYRATHDPLTGLANRALFFDRLRYCLTRAQRHSEKVGLLNIDMDGLKPINDRYGHRAGDAAIKEVSSRLAGVSRRSDTVARMGGDEFGVILSPIGSREAAHSYASRVCERLNVPFEFEQQPINLSASLGIAVFPDNGTEIEVLIDEADRLMYEVKRLRKSASATAGPDGVQPNR